MKKQRIVILGAGESGTGAAVLAQKKGFDVFVSDKGKIQQKHKDVLNQQNIIWEEEQHTEKLILNASEVIKSPGIPEKAEIVKKILEYSSKEGDVVCDPFLGSGQVAMMSKQLKRNYLGFEIVKKYHDFAKKRLEKNLYRVKA